MSKVNTDHVMEIPKSWTFQTHEVASNFDKHVREQLPWYDLLTSMVSTIAKHYLPDGCTAYDIGASTGNLGAALTDTIIARNIKWIGIDNALSMKDFYDAPGKLEIADAISYPYDNFNLAVCFLSMMFMPVEKRKKWLLSLMDKMNIGGAIIIVDRQQPMGGVISTAMQRVIWQQKVDSGTSPDNILKKELSLCGVQRPLPVDFFDYIPNVKEFFRFGYFAGWVIEKSE